MDVTEALLDALAAVLQASNLELVDVVVSGTQVQVSVERPGGVDLDALAEANKALSRALDDLDPFPGPYTLEVSSPGLERRLRTPAHFARAIGETLSVRTLPDAGTLRRVRGVLSAADASGITLEGPELADGSMRIAYGQIERAKTVFEWGTERSAKPGHRVKGQEKERSRS